MKKKMYVLGVAALVVALLALSGVAQSAMWVGAEIGGNFQPNTEIKVFGSNFSTPIQASVIGGATIGYDFVNAGFGAYAWPDWMKYFSFAMDITYNRINVFSGGGGLGTAIGPGSRVDGYEVAWTFLFMAHYGFLPDSEVPSGRINPYIGVGPAIVWTGIDGTLRVGRVNRTTNTHFGDNAMNVALVVEPGIRWVVLPNVSVDTAFRYRLSQPSWDVDNTTIKANPLHQMAFLLRANYHF
jgi:opacity protein-like surface antigen